MTARKAQRSQFQIELQDAEPVIPDASQTQVQYSLMQVARFTAFSSCSPRKLKTSISGAESFDLGFTNSLPKFAGNASAFNPSTATAGGFKNFMKTSSIRTKMFQSSSCQHGSPQHHNPRRRHFRPHSSTRTPAKRPQCHSPGKGIPAPRSWRRYPSGTKLLWHPSRARLRTGQSWRESVHGHGSV